MMPQLKLILKIKNSYRICQDYTLLRVWDSTVISEEHREDTERLHTTEATMSEDRTRDLVS